MSAPEPIAEFAKDPVAILDYTVDWSQFLPEGDPIVAASATILGDDPDLELESEQFTATHHVIWLSGGEAGTSYFVESQVDTQSGRRDKRTFVVAVAAL